MTRLSVDPASCRPADLERAVAWIRSGRAVIVPTDTLYGLAVDPFSRAAVQLLFALKGRPPDAAIPLIASSVGQVTSLAGGLPPLAVQLAHDFWPGPLSLVIAAPAGIAPEVHGGLQTVAIRVPDHAVARMFCEASGSVMTATSANRSGAPPARAVEDLDEVVRDSRVLTIDAGPCSGGPPSTIVDVRGPRVQLVREGAVPWKRVLESVQE